MKFLVQLLTLVVSVVILFFGAKESYDKTDIGAMIEDFQMAMQTTPATPDDGTTDPTPDPTPDPDPVPCDHVDEDKDGKCDKCLETVGTSSGSEQLSSDKFASLYDNYDPEFADINKQVLSNAINSSLVDAGTDDTGLLSDIVDTYIDQLYGHLDNVHSANEGATPEEQEQAKKEFAEKESQALEGFTDIITNVAVKGEDVKEDEVVSSVEKVLESDVCLNTVASVSKSNSDITDMVQDATQGMSSETKSDIENMLNEAKSSATDPAKKESLDALANMFGITLQ